MNLSSIMTPPQLKWTKLIANQYPPGRRKAASVVYKDDLFIHGGSGIGYTLDDFWCYNFNTKKFQQVEILSKVKPRANFNHVMAVSEEDNSIYLFGGRYYSRNIWKYDMQSKMWTEIISNFSDCKGRFHIGSINSWFMHDRKIYAFDCPCIGCFSLDSFYALDLNTNTWTKIITKGNSKKGFWALVKHENSLYLHCNSSDQEKSLSEPDFLRLNLDNLELTEIVCTGRPLSHRHGHTALVMNNILYILGGQAFNVGQSPKDDRGRRLASVVCCDFFTWSTLCAKHENSPCRRRSYFVAETYKECIYLFGGSDGKLCFNDFYRLEIVPYSNSSLNQTSALVNDFRLLFNNSHGADVCFVIDEKKVYAHKCILSSRSEYFQWILISHNTQQSENEISINDGTSYTTFLKVIEFLYTGGIDNLNVDISIDLIDAAVKYRLPNLILLCEEFMRSELSTKTAIRILNACHKYNVYELREDAIDFVILNWSDPYIKKEMKTITDIKLLREIVLLKC